MNLPPRCAVSYIKHKELTNKLIKSEEAELQTPASFISAHGNEGAVAQVPRH
jgi:hypothetical protein